MGIIEASGNVKAINQVLLSIASTQLPIKLINPDAKVPTRAHDTDAGLDLYSITDIVIKPKEKSIIDTGVAVAIPTGNVGLVFVRSSIGFKHNVTLSNSVGVIDSSYRGSIMAAITNHSDSDFTVKKGDRVAQLVITPIHLFSPTIVDELPNTERGEKGFGSSGT